MTLSTVLDRLRTPRAAEVVAVTLTGSPKTVVAVARALATVTVVTGMSHRVGESDDAIRLDVTCHPTPAGLGGAR